MTTHWEWFAIEHVGHTAFDTSFKHWVTHWAWFPCSAGVVVFGVSTHWHLAVLGVIVDTAVERHVLVWIIASALGTTHGGTWITIASIEAVLRWVIWIAVGFE